MEEDAILRQQVISQRKALQICPESFTYHDPTIVNMLSH